MTITELMKYVPMLAWTQARAKASSVSVVGRPIFDTAQSSCVRNAACATAMTSPAAIPWPDASPKRTATRPSGNGTKS